MQLVAGGDPVPRTVIASSEVAPQDGPYGRFLPMDRAELTIEMEKIIRTLGGEPLPDLLDLSVTALHLDVAANAAYVVPEPVRLPCRIVALGWSDDPDVRPAQMTGWDRCGDAEFVTLTGGHFSFLDPDDDLRALLVDAVRRPGPR